MTNDWGCVPGNPWFIAQCRLARRLIARATSQAELAAAIEPLRWVAARATSTRLLPEQLDPFTGRPLAVTSLTWSHASFVTAVQDYLARHEHPGACRVCGAPARAAGRTMERALH